MILYILYNAEVNKHYIGVTDNLERRLIEHNSENSHYTGKTKGIWKIKFFNEYESSKDAFKEEKRLKKAKNRKYIEWYINQKDA